jgi:hypothetical protein
MTTEELHEILDDEDRKLTVSELQEVIYKLKNDCLDKFNKATAKRDEGFYIGEQNAFQICLDLLEHLQDGQEENRQLKKRLENAVELPCKVGNTVYTFSYGSILECYIHKFTVIYENDSNVIYAVLSAKSEEYCGMLNMFTRVKISDFGKTIFLIKEEAEKALAERSK